MESVLISRNSYSKGVIIIPNRVIFHWRQLMGEAWDLYELLLSLTDQVCGKSVRVDVSILSQFLGTDVEVGFWWLQQIGFILRTNGTLHLLDRTDNPTPELIEQLKSNITTSPLGDKANSTLMALCDRWKPFSINVFMGDEATVSTSINQ